MNKVSTNCGLNNIDWQKKIWKVFFDLHNILWKMRRILTKYYELIWTNMYYESLRNHIFQQGIFNRLKMTYYIASSMNNSEDSGGI